VAALPAADLSGIWTGQITDRNGDLIDLSFRFNQQGDALTGKMYGDNESSPLAECKIAGEQITFMVTTELNGQITKNIFTGTVAGGEIRMTRARVNLKPEAKPPAPQTFVLKRLT
jgi:hypothetical protein